MKILLLTLASNKYNELNSKFLLVATVNIVEIIIMHRAQYNILDMNTYPWHFYSKLTLIRTENGRLDSRVF